ncbi:hypothetical protein [Nonomuraea endophytica]|uniref:hypothetical protein n=1 Tax=Nonomuraea endophytica TaxID=714136 RepID=UPI0037C962BC
MASEGILRFITVRPAKARVQPPPSVLIPAAGLFQQLAAAVAGGADRARLREIARGYSAAADHPEPLDPAALREWFYANQDRPLEDADLDALVRHAYGRALPELVAGEQFAATRARVTDQVLTTALLGDPAGEGQRHLLDAKLLALAVTLSATPPHPTALPHPTEPTQPTAPTYPTAPASAHGPAPDQSTSDQAIPDRTASGHAIPEQAIPRQTAHGDAGQEDTAHGNVGNEDVAPGDTTHSQAGHGQPGHSQPRDGQPGQGQADHGQPGQGQGAPGEAGFGESAAGGGDVEGRRGETEGRGSGGGRGTLGDVVGGVVVVLPGFLGRARQEPLPVPPSIPTDTADQEARDWLTRLEEARRELVRLVTDGRHVEYPDVLAPVVPDGDVERQLAELRAADAGRPRLSASARLSDTTTGVLAQLGQLDGEVLPLRAVPVIEEEMRRAGAQVGTRAVPDGVLAFDGGEIDLGRYHRALSDSPTVTDPPPVPQHSQAGVADLLVVRQKIKAYELGEYAHIENVMAGESRERSTRRLTQVEEIIERETETETEKEKDLQSTTRNELQNEAEKHVKSQLDIEAGLQVSGSYGPAVSFTSSLKAGFSTTTEESQRKASSFSQEVTQRTVEKVREKVRTLVRKRTLEEFEENNRHGFSNNLARHLRGIYRWLNKVYDAQVFNYGQRMMFDFVVPEPAAFYLYGLVENPPQDSELVKPAPPTVAGNPLTPGQINALTYGPLLSRYRVTNAPSQPAELRTASFFAKYDGGNYTSAGAAGKVEIPEGYRAYRATVQATHIWAEDIQLHPFQIVFDGKMYDFHNSWGSQGNSTSWLEKDASVSISVAANAWAVAIDVDCKLSPEAYASWQHAAFDAIITAYQQQLAEYNERKAQRELERSSSRQFGRNPLANRRVERDELKKWVIMMLAKQPELNLDSFRSPTGAPVLDLDKANANGRYIRFLENAFEWQNMLYVFYPHLWGRRARWVSALNVTDPDADFAAFLRAGAARVQVPVRPGFERAVAYFVHTGNVWDGNDVPTVEDELYVPIIDEITTNLGRIDGGVPYPAGSRPWEVVVPTDLVLVQDLSEVPPLRDALRPGAHVTLDAGEG